MRIKFLSVIASFFAVSLAFTSCLKSNDQEIEFPTDATIHGFSLGVDSVVGTDSTWKIKSPAFSIDQASRMVYNLDSLPVGTDVTKMPIKLTTVGYPTRILRYSPDGTPVDTTYVSTDSLDFTNPIQFKIYAPDVETTKIYTIEVRVHKSVPDSLVWSDLSATAFPVVGKQHAVTLANTIYVFAPDAAGQVSVSSKNINGNGNWSALQPVSVDKADYSSVTVFDKQIYLLAEGKVYTSLNATDWVEQKELGSEVKALVAAYPTKLSAICTVDGINKFRVIPTGSTQWGDGERLVPNDFPITVKSSAAIFPLKTNPSLYKATIMGTQGDSISVAWASIDGLNWSSMFNSGSTNNCPVQDASVIYYNNRLYAFGGQGKDGFKTFYESKDEGIAWKAVERNVRFLSDFTGREDYSCVLDSRNYLWVMWSQSDKPVAVWKGRINQYMFDEYNNK